MLNACKHIIFIKKYLYIDIYIKSLRRENIYKFNLDIFKFINLIFQLLHPSLLTFLAIVVWIDCLFLFPCVSDSVYFSLLFFLFISMVFLQFHHYYFRLYFPIADAYLHYFLLFFLLLSVFLIFLFLSCHLIFLYHYLHSISLLSFTRYFKNTRNRRYIRFSKIHHASKDRERSKKNNTRSSQTR